MPIFHIHTDAYRQREEACRREKVRYEIYEVQAAHHRHECTKELAQILARYATKEPRAFVQIDAFAGCGDRMADKDGDTLSGGRTTELMRGSTVRMLIAPDADVAEVARCLRKITDWIDNDRELLAKLAADDGPKASGGLDDGPTLPAKPAAEDTAKVSPFCDGSIPF